MDDTAGILSFSFEDEDACALFRLFLSGAMTWSEFLRQPMPHNVSPLESWEAMKRMMRCVGVHVAVPGGDENGVQNPQHVAMAMTVEMAELLEHFQWLNAADVERLLRGDDPERVALIGEEFADVMMYGLQLADALHIDVTQQILRKIDIVDHRSAKPGEPKR